MSSSMSATVSVDLRVEPIEGVLGEVERSLQTRLDRGTLVRKRRSLGARTDRDTWVRIERRRFEKIGSQGWNGTECAALLEGIVKPPWHRAIVWRQPGDAVMWRADETDLLPGAPIGSSVLVADPELPDEWWQALNTSMDALAVQHTRRVATPDTVTITQSGVAEAVRRFLPGGVDTTVSTWWPAHADLNWANMTGPEFSLFDWEDWGMAPQGLDAASLWGNSLAVPALAERVRHERRRDLETRDGRLMTLFTCAKILAPDAHPEDPRLGPARQMSAQITADLQKD
ncbi:hypothetical protein QMK19_36190 [Streptomyces sp. H10-C2]|uniref:hypothetical protein n=1 Tax=unclassified Streptomyces TaxID=2593676 RepID=UPI0024B8879D|nr:MULTISPECIES: hypothetical protein [unclassified Streptomyces]MDJ0346304.1 hypothetical protein [Streptomyces sp. PH10-H1]MDJ0374913.1 hypothetical protein [Streptomyces sp. H10-C2]